MKEGVMKRKAVLLAAMLAAAALSCTVTQTTGPTTVVVQQPTLPNPTGSPSPGANGVQVVYGEKIAEFGERGPAPEATKPREAAVGNTMAVTCSPTNQDGSEIKRTDAENFARLVYFKQLGGTGAGVFDQDGTNAYNGQVLCKAFGVVVLECSIEDTATKTITKGGDGGNRDTPWSMNCV